MGGGWGGFCLPTKLRAAAEADLGPSSVLIPASRPIFLARNSESSSKTLNPAHPAFQARQDGVLGHPLEQLPEPRGERSWESAVGCPGRPGNHPSPTLSGLFHQAAGSLLYQRKSGNTPLPQGALSLKGQQISKPLTWAHEGTHVHTHTSTCEHTRAQAAAVATLAWPLLNQVPRQ